MEALTYDVVVLWFSVYFPNIGAAVELAAEGLRNRLAADYHPAIMVGSQCMLGSLAEPNRLLRSRLELLADKYAIPYLEMKPGTTSLELLTRIVAHFPELPNRSALLYRLSNSRGLSIDFGTLHPSLATADTVTQIGYISA